MKPKYSSGIVDTGELRPYMLLTFQFGNHPPRPGQPYPYHPFYGTRCFGMISRAFQTADYAPVIKSMNECLLDHLTDFLTTAGETEKAACLQAQRTEVARAFNPDQLAASRAEYLEVAEAHHYGFNITSRWEAERGMWDEVKDSIRKAHHSSEPLKHP